MSRFLAFFAFALFSSVAWTQDLVVSTQPIYLIAQEVTKGIEKPTLLLADQSGHDVSLTPMHRKIIQDAGLVIWLGRAHEAPLDKLLTPNDKAVSILDSGIINALPLRNTRGDALKIPLIPMFGLTQTMRYALVSLLQACVHSRCLSIRSATGTMPNSLLRKCYKPQLYIVKVPKLARIGLFMMPINTWSDL